MSNTKEIYGIIGSSGLDREVMPVTHQMIANLNNSRKSDLVFVVDSIKKYFSNH